VQSETFTPDGMMHYLMTWIAVDDQVRLLSMLMSMLGLTVTQPISVVDQPHFRRFLLYCARQLGDKDIPHRTKTTKAMIALFHRLMQKWVEELRV